MNKFFLFLSITLGLVSNLLMVLLGVPIWRVATPIAVFIGLLPLFVLIFADWKKGKQKAGEKRFVEKALEFGKNISGYTTYLIILSIFAGFTALIYKKSIPENTASPIIIGLASALVAILATSFVIFIFLEIKDSLSRANWKQIIFKALKIIMACAAIWSIIGVPMYLIYWLFSKTEYDNPTSHSKEYRRVTVGKLLILFGISVIVVAGLCFLPTKMTDGTFQEISRVINKNPITEFVFTPHFMVLGKIIDKQTKPLKFIHNAQCKLKIVDCPLPETTHSVRERTIKLKKPEQRKQATPRQQEIKQQTPAKRQAAKIQKKVAKKCLYVKVGKKNTAHASQSKKWKDQQSVLAAITRTKNLAEKMHNAYKKTSKGHTSDDPTYGIARLKNNKFLVVMYPQSSTKPQVVIMDKAPNPDKDSASIYPKKANCK